ncbi:DUF4252 domain-containing protein [Tenacibaculum jejuense]|uniref:Probable lipoprotein n=1 Tax=Tenacibaculum jejuense TaxID=584609 RepID=A0A238U9Z3_9FLAO|nr:DUF4252 domain-containing protein [Tenacibaculum jejuense]SNR16023.1 Probable lipoprotein precursor [Tenacibaculum jejuense]
MKKILTFTILCITVMLSSCKHEESLQTYLIKSEDNANYTRLDFSTSMLGSFFETTSEEDQKTFESIKKLNLAFLPVKKATEEEFSSERKRLKEIMKNTDYKSLFRVNDKRGKATVYYSGNTDAIDEIVAVVYAKELGFGVARIIGDEMNPAKIMNMLKNMKKNGDGNELEMIKDMFGGEFQTKKLQVDPIE